MRGYSRASVTQARKLRPTLTGGSAVVAGRAGRLPTRCQLTSPAVATQRYISKELSHFVGRGRDESDQYDLLIAILRSGWLLHPPFNPSWSGNLSINPNARLSQGDMYTPEVVCFCDIPADDWPRIHSIRAGRVGRSTSTRPLRATTSFRQAPRLRLMP